MPDKYKNWCDEYHFPLGNVRFTSDDGDFWEVKVELKENGDVYAAKGWKKDASDLNIEVLDVLLFTFVDHQTLKIKLVRTNQLSRVSSSIAIIYLHDESIHLVIFLELYIFDKIKKYIYSILPS